MTTRGRVDAVAGNSERSAGRLARALALVVVMPLVAACTIGGMVGVDPSTIVFPPEPSWPALVCETTSPGVEAWFHRYWGSSRPNWRTTQVALGRGGSSQQDWWLAGVAYDGSAGVAGNFDFWVTNAPNPAKQTKEAWYSVVLGGAGIPAEPRSDEIRIPLDAWFPWAWDALLLATSCLGLAGG